MKVDFFTLPTELRLQIAAHVVEQPSNAGLIYEGKEQVNETGIVDSLTDRKIPGFHLDAHYSAASNWSLLRVCRQFWVDFSKLAYSQTRIVLFPSQLHMLHSKPDDFVRNIRKLALSCDLLTLSSWEEYILNEPRLQLEELCIAMVDQVLPYDKYPLLVRLLRHLQNVKSIRFVLDPSGTVADQVNCDSLIGSILKEDHHERYDANNAPQLESTWWTWEHKDDQGSRLFTSQPPKPLMDEQAYLEIVRPLIDDAISNLVRVGEGQSHGL